MTTQFRPQVVLKVQLASANFQKQVNKPYLLLGEAMILTSLWKSILYPKSKSKNIWSSSNGSFMVRQVMHPSSEQEQNAKVSLATHVYTRIRFSARTSVRPSLSYLFFVEKLLNYACS